jgi:hypothetical protein
MPDSSPISRETSLAVKLLLARLGDIAGVDASAKRDPRSILLAIPVEARARVVAVLEEVQARALPGSEGLVAGAGLLLEAARELWTPDTGNRGPEHDPAP